MKAIPQGTPSVVQTMVFVEKGAEKDTHKPYNTRPNHTTTCDGRGVQQSLGCAQGFA